MRLAIVLFACGVTGVQFAPMLGEAHWAWLLAIFGFALWFAARIGWRGALPIGALLLGIAYATLMAHHRLGDALADAWEGRDIEVIGVVSGLPQFVSGAQGAGGTRFEFAVDTILTPTAQVPRNLLLSWYAGGDQSLVAPAVHPGERWRLTLRLKKPHGNANPHGFDYEAWLLTRGIRATGYVRVKSAAGTNTLLGAAAWSPGIWVEQMRERLRDRLYAALAARPNAGVIVALVIGDQRAIDQEDWRLFSRTGVAHLMSISGLHITMIASLIAWLTNLAWRRSVWLMTRVPTPRAAALAGLGAALLYCLLAGFGVPAQRTLFMLGVVAAGFVLPWHASPSRLLCVALLAVLLVDPWAPLAAGFWLSFGAVAVLLYVSVGRLQGATRAGSRGWWRDAVVAQAAVTLGLIPATLILFQQISLVGPLANAVAIPLVSAIITPLALLGTLVPPLLIVAEWLLTPLMAWLTWLDSWSLATWQRAAPPWWASLCAVIGLVWLWLPGDWRIAGGKWVGLAWCLPMIALPSPRPPHGEAWVSTLDVGQGLAMVIQTAQHTLLYDTGPRYSDEADAGNRVVLPYLRATGVTQLDGIIVTHQDEDHAGGAASVLDELPPNEFWSSLGTGNALLGHRNLPRATVPCEAGQRWTWDGVTFTMLHPRAADYASADPLIATKTNNLSCVLKVSAAQRSVLLTADIEAPAEALLLERDRAALRSDALIAPHHGSKTSSTAAFLEAVAPTYVVFPVGYRNRFNHPSPPVWARYIESKATLHRSDTDGAVTVRIGPERLEVERYRSAAPRYWHHR